MRAFKNPSRQSKLIPLHSGAISVPGRAVFEIQDGDYSVQIRAMVEKGELREEAPAATDEFVETPVIESDPSDAPNYEMKLTRVRTEDIPSAIADKEEPIDSVRDPIDDVAHASLANDSGDADSLTIDENRGELEEGKDIVDDSTRGPDVRFGRKAKKKRRG